MASFRDPAEAAERMRGLGDTMSDEHDAEVVRSFVRELDEKARKPVRKFQAPVGVLDHFY